MSERAENLQDMYDLVVIGAGPAGVKAAEHAAYFGKRVALVERLRLGGAVTHTGTLPSKTLRETAGHLAELGRFGAARLRPRLNASVTVEDLYHRQREVTRTHFEVLTEGVERYDNIELVRGTAHIDGPHEVSVHDAGGAARALRTEQVLIATGSRPHRPVVLPFDGEFVFDSDSILQLPRIPTSLVVVGGGAIGVEYASLFSMMGVRVSIIDARERLLPFIDSELTHVLEERLHRDGVQLHLRRSVAGIDVAPTERRVRVLLDDGRAIDAEAVLYAAGRQANSDGLGLEQLGIARGRHGEIEVNEHFRTAVPSISAVGDVIGFPALASTSMEQALVATSLMFGLACRREVSPLLPYGLFTTPAISTVGESEASLAAAGRPYVVGRARYRENARGIISGDATGLMKLLIRPHDRKILGVGIVGEDAPNLIHIGQMAMQLGGTLDALVQSVFNFPTLADVYKQAAYDALVQLQQRAEAGAAADAGEIQARVRMPLAVA